MLAVKSELKRKALHAIQVSSKRETPVTLSKQNPSLESTVETKTSKRKLEQEFDVNDSKMLGLKVFEDETSKESDEMAAVPKPSKKQRLFSDEPVESASKTDSTRECQECLKRKREEEVNLMTSDEPSLQYWKELAEKRREALDESLKENESLHDQIEVLETENSELRVMAEQAKLLAEILESLNNEEEDE